MSYQGRVLFSSRRLPGAPASIWGVDGVLKTVATGKDMTTGKDTAKELGLEPVQRSATILSFPDRLDLALSSTATALPEGGSAEIIIFPGVRIERWDTSAEDKAIDRCSRNSNSVARDLLELLD